MSEYLWSRVEANPKIKIRFHSEMIAIERNQTIKAIGIIDRDSKQETHEKAAGVFIFIGGKPCTEFLPNDIAKDEKGFAFGP